MIADCHMHSRFSGDSEENPIVMIEKAVSLGMSDMCFTEHQDFDYKYDDTSFELDGDSYFKELSLLRDRYSNKIDIGIGAELGLEPHLHDKTEAFAKKYPFDFVIGSTHLVAGVDPYHKGYFEEYGSHGGFLRYFEFILKTLDVCRDFDVYGHLDYVVRYAPDGEKHYSYAIFKDVIDEILKKIISMGKGIELNTGGLYKGMTSTNPHGDIVKRYRELGGEIITVGSDAHMADRIGYSFSAAQEILTNAGFTYYTLFKNREPRFIKL